MKPIHFFLSLLLFSSTISPAQHCLDCGNGAAGIFHATTDTQITAGNYFFELFIIEQGVEVRVIGSAPLEIKCKGEVRIDGLLNLNGSAGTSPASFLTPGIGGQAGPGGFQGADGVFSIASPVSGLNGKGPGYGRGALQMAGTGAGFATLGTSCQGFGGSVYGDSLLYSILGGSGGASGAAPLNGASGAGGGGGGALSIQSCQQISIGITGSITASGGDGGNSDQFGFPGGGGSGGGILLMSRTIRIDGSLRAIGGIGGVSAFNAPCNTGGNGSEGRICLVTQEVNNNADIQPAYHHSQLFNAGIRRVVPAKCHGTPSGLLKARASGGTRPYSFVWSTGHRQDEITQLTAGVYTVTITDAAGCSATESAEIDQPNPIEVDIVSYPQSCAGNASAHTLVNAKGGHPYPYEKSLHTTLWSNTKSAGIMFDFSLTAKTSLKRIFLNLPSTASQTISIYYRAGGMNNFQFDSTQWMLAGHFTVNGMGNEEETPFSLEQLPVLNKGRHALYIYNRHADISGITSNVIGSTFNFDHILTVFDGVGRQANTHPFQAGVSGGMNMAGRIAYTVENDLNTPYLYNAGGSNGAHLLLPSGNQVVTVTDALGCEVKKPLTVQSAQGISPQLVQYLPPRCSDSNDGVLEVQVSPAQNEHYLPSHIPVSGNASAEVIQFTVKKSILLKGIDAYIQQSGPAEVYLINNGFNAQLNNPAAWISLGSYTLQKQTGAQPSSITFNNAPQLAPGTWSILIFAPQAQLMHTGSDALSEDMYIMPEKSSIRTGSANAFATSEIASYGWSGTLRYAPVNPTVSYTWNNGVQQALNTGLGGGTHSITFVQDSACTETVSYTLPAPAPLVLNAAIVPEIDKKSNGSVQLNVSGGTAPYFIQWIKSGQTGAVQQQLPAGLYPIFIADFKGCLLRDTIEVKREISPVKTEGVLHVAPNPGQGHFYVASEVVGMEECRMQIFDPQGRLVRDENTTISQLMQTGFDIHHWADGYYILQVSDNDQVFRNRVVVTR